MLLLKLFLVPSLIALITLAGRRWGPVVAGWLSGFPVVAGPILLMIGIEQGPLFVAQTAQASLSAVLVNVSFGIGYAWAALRFPWYICAGAGTLGFALAAWLLSLLPWSVGGAFAAAVGGLWCAGYAYPDGKMAQSSSRPAPRLELPARMLAGAALTLAVTLFARQLGPTFSGLLTVFPVMGLVFGVFSHLAWGPGGAIRLLRGMLSGLYAFAVFCLVVALAVPPAGVAIGFSAALACALLVQAAMFKR